MNHRKFLIPTETYRNTILRSRGYLPHWEVDGATYSCTWRLHDSLPGSILRQLRDERRRSLENAERDRGRLTVIERARIDEQFALRLDHYLDAGIGSCMLRDTRAAAIVRGALEYFDGVRYQLHAWCILPNHVHVAMTPAPGHRLGELFHSWKSYTAHEINKALGRSGTVWQKEYFDRIVRDEEDMRNVVAYITNNPAKAGLEEWPWVWKRG